MRASGRPPYSHRDPARPVRGGDRTGLSLGALAHRLMAFRASLTRRLSGSPAGLPARPSYGTPGRRAEPSWLTAPAALVGREAADRGPRASAPPAEPHWPDHVFDDRASPDTLDAPSFESRIDRSASSPGVLVRQPRRPASIAPEGGVAAVAVSASAPPAARWTRTPDSVLQERRQRALEAERVALERARAEAQAATLALETERLAPAPAAATGAEVVALEALPPEAADLLEAGVVPLWRQPFVAPPGVRFFRTPDRRPVRPAVELAASTAVIAPVPTELAAEAAVEASARDWSDLPDWSEVQPWFEGGDWSSVEAWAAMAPQTAADEIVAAPFAAPGSDAMPSAGEHLRAQPPRPVYVLDRLVRFDQPPRPADSQDNGVDPEASHHADATAAIRDAFLPSSLTTKPSLALVFGPGSDLSGSSSPETVGVLPEAPRRVPALCAMAARAAIRAAGQRAPVPPALAALPETAPAPAHTIRAADDADRVVIPLSARPVLLRGKAAPQPEPAPVQDEPVAMAPVPAPAEVPVAAAAAPVLPMVSPRAHLIPAGRHLEIASVENADYELPSLGLLALPDVAATEEVDADVLEQNALNLQQTVQDFGVRGDILAVRPGPVVTLYELEPAPAPSPAASSACRTTSPGRCRRSRPASPWSPAATSSVSNCRTRRARPSTCANCCPRRTSPRASTSWRCA